MNLCFSEIKRYDFLGKLLNSILFYFNDMLGMLSVFKHTGKPKDVFRKDSTYQTSTDFYLPDNCEAEFFSVSLKRNMPNF